MMKDARQFTPRDDKRKKNYTFKKPIVGCSLWKVLWFRSESSRKKAWWNASKDLLFLFKRVTSNHEGDKVIRLIWKNRWEQQGWPPRQQMWQFKGPTGEWRASHCYTSSYWWLPRMSRSILCNGHSVFYENLDNKSNNYGIRAQRTKNLAILSSISWSNQTSLKQVGQWFNDFEMNMLSTLQPGI